MPSCLVLPPHPLSSQTRADDERGRGGKRERERVCERENLLLLLYFLLPCCKLNVQREWEREIRVDGAPRVPTHRLSKSIFSVLNKNRKTRTKECFTFISFVAIFLDQNLIFMENAFRSTLKGPFSRSQPWQYPIETPEGPILLKYFQRRVTLC